MIYALVVVSVFLGIISVFLAIIAYKLIVLHRSIDNINLFIKSIRGRFLGDKTKEAFLKGALGYFMKDNE